MADDVLQLLANGRVYTGWEGVRVRRSMVHCAGGFDLQVSAGPEGMTPIQPGARCEVRISDALVITGYVDAVEETLSATTHETRVAGRDKTADLVDCSAISKSGQWRGQKLERIAGDLAAPFGVQVRAEVDTGKPLTTFALQQGETVFEAIERAARIRALLLVADAAGNLVITRAGTRRAATALVVGANVLELRATLDVRDRYSEYVALGQAPGSDYWHGAAVAQIRAVAKDPGVTRYRPLVLCNDAPDLAATLRQRALWEASVRAAKAAEFEATVQGWRHAGGLWEPNALVQLQVPSMDVDAELLITTVDYTLDERGTVARLGMTRPDALTVLPLKEGTDPTSYFTMPRAAGAVAGRPRGGA